jgi:HD-like signal output (HDOD) protein/ActR/RegA family two-component response regulator
MTKILFVDDEPRILEGLRRQLYGRRNEWAMTFVGSGEAALQALGQATFDIVVTDLRMPGMDGTVLLEKVRQQHPHTLRMVLSGHAKAEDALRAAAMAHQSFGKPCDPRVLEDALARSLRLRSLLRSEPLQRLIGSLDSLPTAPRIYTMVCQAFEDPRVTLDAVATHVEKDVALSANMLKLANSAFLGSGRPVSHVRQALTFMGLNPLRAIILSSKLATMRVPVPGFSIDALQRHSLLCAHIAAAIVGDAAKEKEEAFAAGLLHDVGQLVLASQLTQPYARALQLAARDGRLPRVHEAEKLGGMTHAEIGAYLVGLWGLPYPIVEAVALHHDPKRATTRRFDSVAAVYVANVLAEEHVSSTGHRPEPLDMDYLEELGVHAELPRWRQLAVKWAASTKEG